ncbi:hypothetical protein D3C86_1233680 [compost metagenome]
MRAGLHNSDIEPIDHTWRPPGRTADHYLQIAIPCQRVNPVDRAQIPFMDTFPDPLRVQVVGQVAETVQRVGQIGMELPPGPATVTDHRTIRPEQVFVQIPPASLESGVYNLDREHVEVQLPLLFFQDHRHSPALARTVTANHGTTGRKKPRADAYVREDPLHSEILMERNHWLSGDKQAVRTLQYQTAIDPVGVSRNLGARGQHRIIGSREGRAQLASLQILGGTPVGVDHAFPVPHSIGMQDAQCATVGHHLHKIAGAKFSAGQVGLNIIQPHVRCSVIE